MESLKKEVDVCILSKASTEELKAVTHKGIETLLASETDIQFNIFVVEGNRSVNYNQYPNTKTLYSYLPFNYHAYMNLAIKEGKADYVVLCNNDLSYEKNWASIIIDQMNKDPELLSASPFCPQTQNIINFAHAEVHCGYQVRVHVAGWCLFVKRKIFDTIGPLPTEINFWFSDNAYACTVEQHKIKHGLVVNSVVNHHEFDLGITGRTVLSSHEKERLTMGQQAAFQKRWG